MNSASHFETVSTFGDRSFAAAVWFAIAWLSLPALAAADSPRPNLILFLIDDQDYESIAAFGGTSWTPNLDRMASEGMKSTRTHVSSTVCTPSRYTWLMACIGRMGIGTRGAERPGFRDADQLCNLQTGPDEQANLASDPRHADQMRRLRELLTTSLRSVGRPFGEFLPGGNAAPPGQVDAQIAQVKQLDVQGKRVVVPRGESPGSPVPSPTESKKELRKKRKAAR
jgi:hypothetical protein